MMPCNPIYTIKEGVCQGLPSSWPTRWIYLQQALQKGHNKLKVPTIWNYFLQSCQARRYFGATGIVLVLHSDYSQLDSKLMSHCM